MDIRRGVKAVSAAFALGLALSWAIPAHAGLPDPSQTTGNVTGAAGDAVAGASQSAGDTVSGATQTAGDTVAGATQTVGDTVSGATDTVGGAVDGATQTVGDTINGGNQGGGDPGAGAGGTAGGVVDGATDAVGDVVTGTTETVSGAAGQSGGDMKDPTKDVVDKVTGVVGQAVDTVKDTVDEVTGRPQGGSVATREPIDAQAYRARGRLAGQAKSRPGGSSSAKRAYVGAASTRGLVGGTAANGDPSSRSTSSVPPSLGERLRRAAVEASKHFALPLTLTFIVLGFVIAQHWADRRDPKLAFAPIDAGDDLLGFS